jgi:hypothetical protein
MESLCCLTPWHLRAHGGTIQPIFVTAKVQLQMLCNAHHNLLISQAYDKKARLFAGLFLFSSLTLRRSATATR